VAQATIFLVSSSVISDSIARASSAGRWGKTRARAG
jgi:hypothetical protein